MTAGTSRRQRALTDERCAGAALQREPHAGTGDHEQQRHPKAMSQVHGQLQRRDGLRVLRCQPQPTNNMPV